MRVAAVVPAYNEERWVIPVLKTLTQSSVIHDVILVSDGSTDGTYEAAAGYDGVKAIKLPENVGKGGAMVAGAKHAEEADILAFFDADLIGLTPSHVEALLQPVLDGKADMTIGIFKGGRPRTDWAQSIAPYISGQRAIRRKDFLSVPGLEGARYGAEIAVGRHARSIGLVTALVPLVGVTHPMKEEKLGWLRGTLSRAKMYWEILKLVAATSRESGMSKRASRVAAENEPLGR